MGEKRRNVLLVDDHRVMRALFRTLLGEDVYTYLEASDGIEAFQCLEGGPKIDLILCDYQMPGTNGLDFLKMKQKKLKFKGVPVIMVSSVPNQSIREQCQDFGLYAWISKPFKREDLQQRVSEALRGPPLSKA